MGMALYQVGLYEGCLVRQWLCYAVIKRKLVGVQMKIASGWPTSCNPKCGLAWESMAFVVIGPMFSTPAAKHSFVPP